MNFDKRMEPEVKIEEWDWKSKGEEVKKKILKKGKWVDMRPTEGSICRVTIDNIVGDWNSNLVGEKVIIIGDSDTKVDKLIERSIMTMDILEEAVICLGNVSCRLILQEYSLPDVFVYDYTIKETLVKVSSDKDRGNEYFREGKYEEAYSRFCHAVKLLIFAGKTNEKVLSLYLTICNNIALCHIKLNKPELAIEVCDKVIQYDEKNVKALLRRAFASNELRDFEKSYSDLVKVLQKEPNNAYAKELLSSTKLNISDMNKRYKSMVQKMFKYP